MCPVPLTRPPNEQKPPLTPKSAVDDCRGQSLLRHPQELVAAAHDETFGSAIQGYRGDCDFTVKFKRILFAIIPATIFIAACLPRIHVSASKHHSDRALLPEICKAGMPCHGYFFPFLLQLVAPSAANSLARLQWAHMPLFIYLSSFSAAQGQPSPGHYLSRRRLYRLLPPCGRCPSRYWNMRHRLRRPSCSTVFCSLPSSWISARPVSCHRLHHPLTRLPSPGCLPPPSPSRPSCLFSSHGKSLNGSAGTEISTVLRRRLAYLVCVPLHGLTRSCWQDTRRD